MEEKGWGRTTGPDGVAAVEVGARPWDQLPLPGIHGQELSKGVSGVQEGGYMQTAQSALAVLKLVISGLISVILTVFSTMSLQYRVWFAPISVRPFLRVEAAYVADYSL